MHGPIMEDTHGRSFRSHRPNPNSHNEFLFASFLTGAGKTKAIFLSLYQTLQHRPFPCPFIRHFRMIPEVGVMETPRYRESE